MGKKDIATKDYVKDNRVFADAFNQMIYQGEQVIKPEKLRPMDTALPGIVYGADGTQVKLPVQKFRDGIKCLAAMEDDSAAYLILGIENQSEVHYAMPVRDMLYDALQYMSQVELIAERHEMARKLAKATNLPHERGKSGKSVKSQKTPNAGEFLSSFYKEDRLCPVITVVVHFGTESWDGARSLHEMLEVKDPKLLAFVPDYKLNLLSPADMTDQELNRFTSSLREVMLFIKYANDKDKLKDMLQQDEGFQHLDSKALNVINTVTGAEIEFSRKEEDEVMMCQAMREIREDFRREGLAEGRAEGRAEKQKIIVFRMLERGKDSYEEIAELTEMPLDEVKRLAAECAGAVKETV
ncbi:MAG: transposase [Lachnospiraceae bacterium]|nr:transposase [Lachnospiraceae bacterium]